MRLLDNNPERLKGRERADDLAAPRLAAVRMRPGLQCEGGHRQHRDHKESQKQRVFQKRKKLNSNKRADQAP